MLVLKTFLSQRKLNDTYTGGIGSFVLCMMIVSFLQMKQQELTVTSNTSSPHAWNLGVLLVDFFDLYGGSFNFIHTGISTSGLGAYFNKQNRDSTDWFNTMRPALLAIENPDLNDINMGNNSYMITKIRKCFEHMRLVCGNILRGHCKSYLAHVIRPDDPVLVARAKKLSSSLFPSTTALPRALPTSSTQPTPARATSSHLPVKSTEPNQNNKARRKELRAKLKQEKRSLKENNI
jgi:non-canonical poly(A) RNA polymerase PAPD5/7